MQVVKQSPAAKCGSKVPPNTKIFLSCKHRYLVQSQQSNFTLCYTGDCIRQNTRICPRHENNPALQCTNVTIFSDLSHAHLRKTYHLYFIHGTNAPKEVTFFPITQLFCVKRPMNIKFQLTMA